MPPKMIFFIPSAAVLALKRKEKPENGSQCIEKGKKERETEDAFSWHPVPTRHCTCLWLFSYPTAFTARFEGFFSFIRLGST